MAQEKSSRRSQRRNQDGGAERRLLFATATRAAERHVRRETIRPLKIELAGVLIWCQRFQTIQCRRASRDSGNQPTNGCAGPIVGALHLAAAIRTRSFSIGVFTVGRPRLAIDASGKTWAVRTRRHGREPNLTGIANDKGSMDMPMVLLGCLGHGWCNRHRCRYGQCQKSDRKFAHASLPG